MLVETGGTECKGSNTECFSGPARRASRLSCLAVDEYIAIAKEKHGYNMEQVTERCAAGGGVGAGVSPRRRHAGAGLPPPGGCVRGARGAGRWHVFPRVAKRAAILRLSVGRSS